MFKVDDKQIKNLEKDLKTFKSRAFPFATKATVNSSAFKAQRFAKEDIKKTMILRNKFTLSSIRVEKTNTLNVSRQAALMGSTADYMADQQFGAVKSKSGKTGVPIATSYAAGLGENAQPRTRLPRRANKMSSIKLRHSSKRGSRKQRNYIAIMLAAQSGRKYVYLDLARSKGIFKTTQSRKNPKLKMIYDMSRQSVTIPANPWLMRAVDEVQPLVPSIYKESLVFQLKRHGLFR